jgi:hypothetical protein
VPDHKATLLRGCRRIRVVRRHPIIRPSLVRCNDGLSICVIASDNPAHF